MVVRVSFDKDAPSPKLLFKPVGWLPDAMLDRMEALYDDEVVQEMVGTPSTQRTAHSDSEAPAVNEDEIDAALGARKAVAKAAATAKPALAAPAVEVDEIDEIVKPKAAAPVKKAAAKPAAVDDTDSLLADMDALLGNKDD